jgi:small-conductance mechanosensitive channel
MILSPSMPTWLTDPLVEIGEVDVTPGLIIRVAAFLVAVWAFAWFVRRKLVLKILERTDVDAGVRYAVARIASYVVWMIAILVGLPMVGIQLSSLVLAFGTLGIGIGFGLQKIAQDFVSGLILLIERPVKVGDRVEVGGTVGTVLAIQTRVTSIRTNDNVDILVPNSEFVSARVVNLSHADKITRFRFQVGVSYGSDPERVRKCLLEVAAEHPGILGNPDPDVLFVEFGESSLNFVLRVYAREMLYFPDILKSEVNFAIWRKLKQAGIKIPFPQRDLHIKTVTEDAASRLGGS